MRMKRGGSTNENRGSSSKTWQIEKRIREMEDKASEVKVYYIDKEAEQWETKQTQD